MTSYRRSHDGAEKLWLTIDGETVAQFGHYDRQYAEVEELHRGASSMDEIWKRLDDRHKFGPSGAGDALREYLELPVEDALVSAHGLIRALAVADRRLGRRRLAQLDPMSDPFPLVLQLYELRCGRKRA